MFLVQEKSRTVEAAEDREGGQARKGRKGDKREKIAEQMCSGRGNVCKQISRKNLTCKIAENSRSEEFANSKGDVGG